jgi:bacterioferritin
MESLWQRCMSGHVFVQATRIAETVLNLTEPMLEKIMDDATNQTAINALNKIMEFELAGVVKYTHYSLMIYGYNRIPIVSWLKGNADESLVHAHKAGELVTLLGGHPSLKIGPLLETQQHDIGDILRESLEHEKSALAAYYDLLKMSEGKSVLLEEYAREMIVVEELHLDEVNKMLRRPGSIDSFKS